MSIGAFAGVLNGLAAGKNNADDRKDRRSLIDAMGKMESRPDQGTSFVPGGTGGGGSDSGRGQTFTYDGKIGDRVSHAYSRFIEAGIPSAAAAGFVGNLMQESGPDINPAAVGDNGNAFGSGQMNGPRKRAYMAFAKERGANPTDFDTQIDWMLHEGQTTEKGAWDAVLAANSPEEAALIASQKYWRPGTPHNERRQGFAASVYSRMNKPAPPASPAPAPSQAPGGQASEGPSDWAWFRKYGKGV